MARKHTLKLRELRGIRVRFAIILTVTAAIALSILLYLGVRLFVLPHKTKYLDQYFNLYGLYFYGFASVVLAAAQFALLRQLTVGAGRVIEEMTYTDELTGLGNRRHIAKVLAEEFREAQLSKNPLSLVFMDLDDFKQINDRHGHKAGDLILRAAGHALKETVREADLVGRAGGDEFVVILPDTDSQCASVVARRIAERIAAISVTVDSHVVEGVSASIGISAYPANANTPKVLLDDADRSMYAAKNSGKGTIVISIARAVGPEPRASVKHITTFATQIEDVVNRGARGTVAAGPDPSEDSDHG